MTLMYDIINTNHETNKGTEFRLSIKKEHKKYIYIYIYIYIYLLNVPVQLEG